MRSLESVKVKLSSSNNFEIMRRTQAAQFIGHVLAFVLNTCYVNGQPSTAASHRVAFIFAGSPRSFVETAVSESISYNLIAALCPRKFCHGDIFWRVSYTDNINLLGSAKGMTRNADNANLLMRIMDLAESRFRQEINGLVISKRSDIGSETEKREQRTNFNSLDHQIFRDLDPRRYSMYFNRWSAYRLALEYEKKIGVEYTWMVHCRFDAAWFEPILPIMLWPPDRVWVPDCWFEDTVDTFALIPRKYSDGYFSVDDLVTPGAMCLGGPDFNTSTIEKDYLVQLGYNDSMQLEVNNRVCDVMIPDAVRLPMGENHTVSEAGFSEHILKRKLAQSKIGHAFGTLGYASLAMVIVRSNLLAQCFFLERGHFIGYAYGDIRAQQSVSLSTAIGCTHMFRDLQYQLRSNFDSCPRNGPYVRTTSTSSESILNECLLNRAYTDWNFMPFLILNRQSHCITANASNDPSSNNEIVAAVFQDCVR